MEPFIGQIILIGFGFPPRGFAFCNGQLLPIAQNTALFSLLGTTFGGDGETTFALPDLRGRIAKHVGTGAGLSQVSWGERGGVESVVHSLANLPSHTHTFNPKAGNATANVDDPSGAYPAGGDFYGAGSAATMGQNTTNATGSGSSIDIRNPYLGIYHCIALTGIFPSQS